MMSKRMRFAMGYAAVFIAATLLLCYEIDEPFTGQHDSGSAAMANYARNMIRYGYWGCKMGQIVDSGPLGERDQIHYYLHCAPILSFLVSLSFRLFGIHEWSTRLVPIAQALGCVLLTVLIAQRLWGKGIALAASCLLVASPVFAYYGRVADLITFGFGYLLLTMYAYVRWHESRRATWLIVLLAATLAGVLASLEVWLLPLLLAIHYYLTAQRRSKVVLLVPLMTFLGLALQAAHMVLLVGFDNVVADAIDAFGRRTMLKGDGINFVGAVGKQAVWSVEYLTPVPLLLALIWAGSAIVRWWTHRRAPASASAAGFADSVILIMFVNAMVVTLMFPKHSANHEFSLYGWMPAMAMAAALGLRALWLWLSGIGQRTEASGRRRLASVVCCLVLCTFAANGLTNWLRVHRRTFYSPCFEVALQINAMTDFDQWITLNVPGPPDYPGYYMPFYLDRRVAWGVGSVAEARKRLLDGTGRYGLAVFLVRDPATGHIRLRTLRRGDLM